MNNAKNYDGALISVVDDDQSVRNAAKSLLNSSGFRAEVFASPDEFLESPLKQDTHCLILDLRMPGMNGLEMQRRLITERCKIPIVFITAYEDKKTREEALRRGAIEFLSKPFKEDALLEAIQRSLKKEEWE